MFLINFLNIFLAAKVVIFYFFNICNRLKITT